MLFDHLLPQGTTVHHQFHLIVMEVGLNLCLEDLVNIAPMFVSLNQPALWSQSIMLHVLHLDDLMKSASYSLLTVNDSMCNYALRYQSNSSLIKYCSSTVAHNFHL
ncbi:hypothetical protein D3C75_785260 [compost metagenome]